MVSLQLGCKMGLYMKKVENHCQRYTTAEFLPIFLLFYGKKNTKSKRLGQRNLLNLVQHKRTKNIE